MPTNPNMKPIQTVTVPSGGASSIEFGSASNPIPQTYTDLVIVYSARTNSGAGTDEAYLTFNNNNSNYSWKMLVGDGSNTPISINGGDTTSIAGMQIPGGTSTASTFSNGQIYISNYAGSNNKSVSSESVQENNQTTAYIKLVAGMWSNSNPIISAKLSGTAGSFVEHSTATLYGITSASYGATKATGGFISQTDTHWIHSFYDSGTFTPTQNLTADILVVAGGGGGGGQMQSGEKGGGGGGGGGVIYFANESLSSNTGYSITVGAGGSGNAGGYTRGDVGINSTFANKTSAIGGGGGAGGSGSSGQAQHAGSNGGSGGGGVKGGARTSSTQTGAGATAFHGNPGGVANEPAGEAGGGGGGAGAQGSDVPGNSYVGGNGGIGTGAYSSWTNPPSYYAGGGGGGAAGFGGLAGGAGGEGGGGAGGAGGTNGSNGVRGTGGGGGGRGSQPSTGAGANGGGGVIIVRYLK